MVVRLAAHCGPFVLGGSGFCRSVRRLHRRSLQRFCFFPVAGLPCLPASGEAVIKMEPVRGADAGAEAVLGGSGGGRHAGGFGPGSSRRNVPGGFPVLRWASAKGVAGKHAGTSSQRTLL